MSGHLALQKLLLRRNLDTVNPAVVLVLVNAAAKPELVVRMAPAALHNPVMFQKLILELMELKE